MIGGGPAGLAAAEVLASRGMTVTLAEAKPSLGRKFLMAGKSGLNLTMDLPFDSFAAGYGDGADWLRPHLASFDNQAVQHWATDLGQTLFTGSTGRVFPRAMKASPLLRAWIARLSGQGVRLQTRWRWTGLSQKGRFAFDTPDGRQDIAADVTVLALGGASWSRLGSDGEWADLLSGRGVPCRAFVPSNMGIRVDWSRHMAPAFGRPLKNIALRAGTGRFCRGEAMISARGLEGSLVYQMSPAIRQGLPLFIDLLPDLSADRVAEALTRQPKKASLSNAVRKGLNLDGAKTALLLELVSERSRAAVAAEAKSLPLRHAGAAPLQEAISTAGGVDRAALDGLMLRALPGVFCAGEMIDWDAPTGGYLLTACLALGRAAGAQAADYASRMAAARS